MKKVILLLTITFLITSCQNNEPIMNKNVGEILRGGAIIDKPSIIDGFFFFYKALIRIINDSLLIEYLKKETNSN